MACGVEQEMIVDWAPVSTMALTGRPSIDTSSSNVGPTAGTPVLSAQTVLVALPPSRACSRRSLRSANTCSSCSSVKLSVFTPGEAYLYWKYWNVLGLQLSWSNYVRYAQTQQKLPSGALFPASGSVSFNGPLSSFDGNGAVLGVRSLLLFDWSEWAAALAAYCFSYCSIII